MAADTQKVTSNLIWRFLERCGAQGVSFVVSIVIARILDPEVYGTIALVAVFTTILNVFIDSGLGSALIQKKDADDVDFSTVFFFNVFMCVVVYLLLYFAAPLIGSFYANPELVPIVRVLGVSILISGIKNIQIAYVSKHLIFKKFFFSTLGGTIGAAFLGIWMAVKGYGVWALVYQGLFNNFVDTVILWITVKWRPKLIFSMKRLKNLLSYGWKLLVSALIDTTYTELRQLLIGKIYTSDDLAFYNRGENFPKLIVQNINASIDSVLLPTMSEVQDNRDRVKAMTRRSIKTSTYIMMPMMIGLAVCAEPIIQLFLTDKWLDAVFFMRVFCFSYIVYPIHTANLNAIKAVGRSDLFLKLEIIKKILGLAVLLSTMWFGVEIIALSCVFTSIICQLVNSWPNKKLLGYSYLEQLADMLPQMILSACMGVIVYSINFISISSGMKLLIQIPLGIVIYIGLSILFKVESYEYVQGVISKYLKKGDKK